MPLLLEPARAGAGGRRAGYRDLAARARRGGCKGYDHGYWFIQAVIADHLAHHARELAA